MTDCMNMEFYRELYVSRSLKKREKRIIEGLKKETVSKGSLSDRVSPGKTKSTGIFLCIVAEAAYF